MDMATVAPAPPAKVPVTTSTNTGAENLSLSLPIEVLGPDGFRQSVSFNMGATQYIQHLRLTCSRCGYRSGANDADRTKASVRFNGGPWLPINRRTALFDDKTRGMGGFNSGLMTVTFDLPLRAHSIEGRNTLEFRFEGTDGFTNGYRIIDADLVTAGGSTIPKSRRVLDGPSEWTAPRPSAFDIRRGKELWEGTRGPQLRISPLTDARWTASCAACHAADGRDLKYFNYSNFSIQQRARFHGLSQVQGERIASYIRSLDTPAPAKARPWNPPYQPGPGLDDEPVENWSAGAGLEAVLHDDLDMIDAMFPNGTRLADMRPVVSTKESLNIRELPIAVQLPDWKQWLPEVHPMDVWPDLWADSEPQLSYEAILTALTERDPSTLSKSELLDVVSELNAETRAFVAEGKTEGPGTEWRTYAGAVIDARDPRYTDEDARRSLANWMAVKYWELHQTFGLEDEAPRILPEGGELRSWLGKGQNVHPNAPHITALGQNNWTFQTEQEGDYASTVWYQLQMILNSGQRQRSSVQPQDWPYQFRHVVESGARSDRFEPLRYTSSLLKGFQNADNDRGTDFQGWQMRFTHPRWFFGSGRDTSSLMTRLNEIEPGLQGRVTEALLLAYLDKVESIDVDTGWTREKNGQPCLYENSASTLRWYCVPPKNYIWMDESNVPIFGANRRGLHVERFREVIPMLAAVGVRDQTTNRLIDWCAQMWPANDWESLRP